MDEHLKIGTAVWWAIKAIKDQMEEILARERAGLAAGGITDPAIVEEACADLFNNRRRAVLDPFTVGYAIGLATGNLMLNDVKVDQRVTAGLVSGVHERLEPLFPGIQTFRHYQDPTYRMTAGLLFGLKDPGRSNGYFGFRVGFDVTSFHSLGPGVELAQQAARNFGIDLEQQMMLAAGREIEEMRTR